jgi:hypothetical protein
MIDVVHASKTTVGLEEMTTNIHTGHRTTADDVIATIEMTGPHAVTVVAAHEKPILAVANHALEPVVHPQLATTAVETVRTLGPEEVDATATAVTALGPGALKISTDMCQAEAAEVVPPANAKTAAIVSATTVDLAGVKTAATVHEVTGLETTITGMVPKTGLADVKNLTAINLAAAAAMMIRIETATGSSGTAAETGVVIGGGMMGIGGAVRGVVLEAGVGIADAEGGEACMF